MAINVYTGLMGSGKSYEVVSGPILDGIAQGRRVVTNVDGINGDLIRAYVSEKRGIPLDKLGEVLHVTNEQCASPDFLPYYDKSKSSHTDTTVQPGDLVCIDEAWRIWGTDCKLLDQHKSFFLEHRHFVHPVTNVACDLVLMIQDMGTLHRFVRVVVAFSYRTHKKVSLFGTNTRQYSVEQWEGSKMTKGTRLSSHVKLYDKDVFPLYSSFKGGVDGKQATVDRRQNVLFTPLNIVLAISVPIVFSASIWFLWRYFHGGMAGKGLGGPQAAASAPRKPSGAPVPLQGAAGPSPRFQDASARIVGDLVAGGQHWVVVADLSGKLRFMSPGDFMGRGSFAFGTVDGQRVTPWSLPLPGQVQQQPSGVFK